jgi:ketosteroid isomerase-like protein
VTAKLAIVLSCVALTGCLSWRHSEEALPLRSPSRDSLLQVDLRRAEVLATGGWAGVGAAFFAEDIAYLRAGAPPIYGRPSVAVMIESNPRLPTSATWQPLGGGVSRDRLSGFTFGVAVYPHDEGGAPGVARYIAFWKRQHRADWKILAYAEVGPASPVVKQVPDATLPAAAQDGVEARRAALAIAASDSDFADDAAISGTANAFGNAAAPDGIVFGGPEIVFGPAAIHDLFDAQRGTSLSWHPLYSRAAESGDLGFSIGESIATSRGQSGAAVQRFGKYLTIWRKEPNGDWKYVIDGGNARPSPVGR